MYIFKHFRISVRRVIIFIIQTVAALFIELSVLNYLQRTNSSIKNNGFMSIFQFLINNIGVVMGILLTVLLVWQLWYWHRKDKKLKQDDFRETLIKILREQRNFTNNTINNHIKGLKDSFIKPLKNELQKDKIDKQKIIEILDYKFDHHKTAFSHSDNIDDLLNRLELHKTGEILNDIRYEKAKKQRDK